MLQPRRAVRGRARKQDDHTSIDVASDREPSNEESVFEYPIV
jgi:hypothetical protein